MSVYVVGSFKQSNTFEVSLETLIIYHIMKFCKSQEITLHIVLTNQVEEPKFIIEGNFNVVSEKDVPKIASYCVWPVIVVNRKVVAGLCAVSRQIIKSSKNGNVMFLLGFKDSCLLACSETSIWTKFCEIDVVNTTKDVILHPEKYVKDDVLYLPECFTKFEFHMSQPVRMHNVYKLARQLNNDKSLKSSIPIEDLNLTHKYAEGLYMTLADVLLRIGFQTMIGFFGISDQLSSELPLMCSWLNITKDFFNVDLISNNSNKSCGIGKIIQSDVIQESLYSSDPNRNKVEKNVNVSLTGIESLCDSLDYLKIERTNDFIPYGNDIEFDWNDVPLVANPLSGALPKKRADRKGEQLVNLAKATIKIAQNKNYKIVDFCSGGGHLGILLAILLPTSKIILVENKERSLLMAQERIEKLKLQNIDVVQSNLDYFIGTFNLGVSLHACGVATDLVIQKSIDNNADFLCCPCCYGSIRDCHQVKYPRSDIFGKSCDYGQYLNVAHGADQTHSNDNPKTKVGFLCMDIIDTDRRLFAESCGYKVNLGKLQPTSCTPKNNLLVGIFVK